jgi:thiol-disulfide isomerase/thioredoxin
MRILAVGVALLGLLFVATPARGEEEAEPEKRRVKHVLPVGSDAPAVTATTWLNTAEGQSPVPEDLSGKLLMIEFWGTWCAPCVRSMPKVQALHERYKALGLIVVAITREGASDVRGWLKEKGYSMPVGCDPSQACIDEYEVRSWPTTYLVGSNGTVLFAGAPYRAEAAIEKALGLPTNPGVLLTAWLDAGAGKDESATREAMKRLLDKAPAAFDCCNWAKTVLGEAPEVPDKKKKLKGGKALAALEKDWTAGPSEGRDALLTELALFGPTDFDLRSWVAAAYAKAHPLRAKDVEAFLAEKRYRQLLDALIDRAASSALIKKAGRHDGFSSWCDRGATERWTFARKGVMVLNYWMSDDPPPKGIDWEAFSRDLSVNSWTERTDPETGHKKIVGIGIGGEMIMKDVMPFYIHRQLARSILMNTIAGGNGFRIKTLDKVAAKEHDKILASLRRKYG